MVVFIVALGNVELVHGAVGLYSSAVKRVLLSPTLYCGALIRRERSSLTH